MLAVGCSRSDKVATTATTAAPGTTLASGDATTTTAIDKCKAQPLQATDVGITATDITVETMADVGSTLAPGLFQGNLDAMKAFETFVNASGGIGCRKLVVKTFDSALNPTESKNGLIDSCKNAFAMVGGNALFNPDVTPMTGCVDKAGVATGLPDIGALANDLNEQCAATAFIIQGIAEKCPVIAGPRPETIALGPAKFLLKDNPGLHGLFLIPGDLPTTVQSSTPQIAGLQAAGITWDATPKVSGRDPQPAFTPRVQIAKEKGSTYVQNGSNDVAMIKMRKEANAQGLTSVKVWACSLACYTKNFISQGGTDVEGTFVSMQFLPFEEASSNAALKAYVDGVGAAKTDSFGAQAWQAGMAFKQAVDKIVADEGPNAITRAKLLTVLKGIKNFDADGWAAKKNLQGDGAFSPCFLMLQVKQGKFVRVHPTEVGTMDCDPGNVTTVTIDPVAAAAALK